MIRRISLISMVLLLFVGFGYAAANSSYKSMSKSSMMKREGTIEKINPATNTIAVQVGSEIKTFKFSNKTIWIQDGKKIKNVDLKVGDKVTVYPDSKNFARRIEASPHTS